MNSQQLEHPGDTPVVGSAEPLSREETLVRLRQLQEWGVDISLVRANLAQTPTERLREMLGLLTMLEGLRRSRAERPTSPARTARIEGDQEEAGA